MPRRTIQKNLSYDSDRHLYYVIFHEGCDGHGKRTRRTRTFRTYQEALAAQRGETPQKNGRLPPDPRCVLRDWLSYWLEEIISRDHAVSTVYGYRNMIVNHINPHLGDVSVHKLKPIQIQSYLHERMDAGLSPNTVLKHYVLLHSALALAVRMDLLERSPMDRVLPPKRHPARHTFYTPEQIQTLFAAVQDTWMELAVKLAAYLGLRRGEICGLQWPCVDFDQQVILIRETRTEIGGVPVTKGPKTNAATRTLSIAGLHDLQSVLQRAYQCQGRPENGYVLLLEDGRVPLPDQVTWTLQNIVRQRALPKITIHGLRHSFASVANSQSVQMFDISRALGHSSIAVTSNIYTHLFDETQQEAIQAVAKAIENR